MMDTTILSNSPDKNARHVSPSLSSAVEAMLRMKAKGKLECSTGEQLHRLSDRYTLHSEIGRGHFGVVRTCISKETGHRFACKTMLKSSVQKDQDLQELCSEVLNMAHLGKHSPRPTDTVQLHDVIEDDSAFHLILDHCPGGDLFDHVSRNKRLSEKETAQILCQLALAAQGMHSCGVVHRDLKPENVLLSEPPRERGGSWKLKVADFGLCVQLGHGQKAKGVAGSPFYMAPEVVLGREYGPEVDVWSLGVITYTCLAGNLPFYGRSHDQIFSAVCRGTLDFKRRPWPLVSYDAKSLICLMLDRDPNRRIRLTDILQHPWIQRHCTEFSDKKHCSFFTKALQGFSGTCRSSAPGSSKSPGHKVTRSPSHMAVEATITSAHTVADSARNMYINRTATADESRGRFTSVCQGSDFSEDSVLTSQSSFAFSAIASPASSAVASTGSGEGSPDSKASVDLPRHKVPGGSRKGFSAPLTRQECEK